MINLMSNKNDKKGSSTGRYQMKRILFAFDCFVLFSFFFLSFSFSFCCCWCWWWMVSLKHMCSSHRHQQNQSLKPGETAVLILFNESAWFTCILLVSYLFCPSWKWLVITESWSLWMSLVQTRLTIRSQASVSGLYLVMSWKPPRMEAVQSLWATC